MLAFHFNIKQIIICKALFCVLAIVVCAGANGGPISGQGTWETTLQGRDLDGDTATAEAYYDTVLNITWLANGNAGAGSIYDTVIPGLGWMYWDQANAWVSSFNPYGSGITGWRLPDTVDVDNDGATYTNYYQGVDYGYNITAHSELSHMFYVTLGNSAQYDTSGNATGCGGYPNPYYCLTNTGPFTDLNHPYWSRTSYAPDTNVAWYFSHYNGLQSYSSKTAFSWNAWAVHDGDVGTPLGLGDTVDLVVAKSVNITTPGEGQTLRYTVQLTNNGPTSATNVVVTDVIPAGLSYVASSINGGDSRNDIDPNGVGLRWAIVEIASGSSLSLAYDANVDSGQAGNTITNTVITTQTETDTNATSDNPSSVIMVGMNSLPVTPAGLLNDTGVLVCSDGASSSSCPKADYPGQDAEAGRDAAYMSGSLTKIGDGRAGFDFTKIDIVGNTLPPSATSWSCVIDNVTGLMWEVKTNDGGLRDKHNYYSWHDPNPETNGGSAGTSNGGICNGSACDTDGYVQAINALGLCGFGDWRMPTYEELQSIIDYGFGANSPFIDPAYFPNISNSNYVTAATLVDDSNSVWALRIYNYWPIKIYKSDLAVVRLVRKD